jgi:hypothetical protein
MTDSSAPLIPADFYAAKLHQIPKEHPDADYRQLNTVF